MGVSFVFLFWACIVEGQCWEAGGCRTGTGTGTGSAQRDKE